jgi:putative ABC transport system permease protein
MGETIELPTPGGALRLPVVGIIVDYSDQQGTIVIDRHLFEERWRDDTMNFFRVYLGPGARWDDVKARILERYAGKRQVFVLNNDELRRLVS